MNKFPRPETDTEALTQALVLAITAPSEKQQRAAVLLASCLAAGLTPKEVAACKAIAKEMAD